MITTKTKLVAILGDHVAHSKSPVMMNAAFQDKGLDYYYIPVDVAADDFGDVVRGISKMNFAGFTITMPYKLEIMKYLDEIDPVAEVIGAVNTVKITDKYMKGYNTDGEGFVSGIERDGKVKIQESTFFIIGAGGVARAISAVLASRHPRMVYIANRTFSKAEELCRKINEKIYDCCVPLPLDQEGQRYIPMVNVVINGSNIGMKPYEKESPIDVSLIHGNQLVMDVIYQPAKTILLQVAEEKGCQIINGENMLVYQGEIAYHHWTGIDPDIAVMKRALEVSRE